MRLEDIATAIRSNPVVSEVSNRNLSVKMGKPLEAGPDKSVAFTSIPEWGENTFLQSILPSKLKRTPFQYSANSIAIPTSSKLSKSGEVSSRSIPQSTGSNIDTRSLPIMNSPLPENSTMRTFDNANIQQASEDDSATIVSRELALTTLRQNQLILSKLNRRQKPVTSTSSRSHILSVFPFALPTEIPTLNNIHLIFPYSASIVLFLTLLVAIVSALTARLMADKERRMWLESSETARMTSVLLQEEGGFWERGSGVGAGGWGLGPGACVEGLKMGYLGYILGDRPRRQDRLRISRTV